jgi:hypothetical protein
MNLVLVGKKRILFEKNKRANDLIVMFIPTEESIQVFHDLQGNKTDYEVASRAGVPDKKPVWREEGGKVVLYGLLPEDLASRTSSLRVWLAQDFLPADTTIFYFVVSPQHLVHGRMEVSDENKVSWRVTTLQVGTLEEMVALIKSSLVDQMMTGENQVPCVAVYQDNILQNQLNEALKHLQITTQPLEKLLPAYRQIKPLYNQRNHTLVLLVGSMFFFMILLASAIYWVLGMIESAQLQNKIDSTQMAIQNVQINERIGFIKEPQAIQEKIKSPFNQLPSALMNAPLRMSSEFGDLSRIVFEVSQGQQNTFMPSAGLAPGVYQFRVEVSQPKQAMLVDQETMAKTIVSRTPWLREISNVAMGGEAALNLRMKVQVEETPEMKSARQAQQPAPEAGAQK